MQHTYMNGWISQYIWVSWQLSKRASCKSAKTSNKQLETRQHVMSVRIQIPSSTSSSSSIVVHLCASSTSMLLELFRANLCILWTIAMACINCCGETNSSLMFTPQRLLLCSLSLPLTAFKTHIQCLQNFWYTSEISCWYQSDIFKEHSSVKLFALYVKLFWRFLPYSNAKC